MKKTAAVLIIIAIIALSMYAIGGSRSTPAVVSVAPDTYQNTVNMDFSGKWAGPEGTSLTITQIGPETYTLDFVMLDGPISATGLEATGGVAFTRNGESFTLRKGTGVDTGMKYLLEKKDCVVVQNSEGYCRD